MPAEKQRSKSLRINLIQWFGLILLALLLAVPSIHWAADAGFSAKLDRLRNDLGAVTTQAEFIGIAKSQGFKCEAATEANTHVRCEWWEARYYDVLWIAKFMATGIWAEGDFANGRKSGEYNIRDVADGP